MKLILDLGNLLNSGTARGIIIRKVLFIKFYYPEYLDLEFKRDIALTKSLT